MDEKDDRRHFSLKGIMENEKKNKKKRKRKAKDEEIVDDNFNVDLEDSRFDALFTSYHFAVDPSDPQYRYDESTKSPYYAQFILALCKENLISINLKVRRYVG